MSGASEDEESRRIRLRIRSRKYEVEEIQARPTEFYRPLMIAGTAQMIQPSLRVDGLDTRLYEAHRKQRTRGGSEYD